MNKFQRNAAVMALSAIIGGSALLPYQTQAAKLAPVADVQLAAVKNFEAQYSDAIKHLQDKGVLQGYEDGQIRPNKPVTNAELLKMVLLTLDLEVTDAADTEPNAKWYDAYVASAVAQGLIAEDGKLQPNKPAEAADTAAILAKALQRDTKSVLHWIDGLSIAGNHLTRGEMAELLVQSEKAVRSEDARIVSMRALNKVALEITFDAPLVLEDESRDAMSDNFAFEPDLKLVNQPRLKTGSLATYIIPMQTMPDGETMTLTYKGEQTVSFNTSDKLIPLREARQVTSDTFEIESLRQDGVIDYGYVISAYAGGRGSDAIVLDENNSYDGQSLEIIPSLATRTAVLTPDNGEPITVSYVGFTQSTDGKQEPKFRLPQGQTLQPGTTYTVTSDWFTVEHASFVAEEIDPLIISSVQAVDGKTLQVTLSGDPGDELFAYRSIQLTGDDGSTLTAQYKVQSRQGAVGTFEIGEGTLGEGVRYTISPAGTWAVADDDMMLDK
ncbi:S-layer homology domain-containing protein [Paenibacillus sp. J5C_2022]|uniref:S-layer homology domain-containing protein n=1 Tax=Paenibacillus sp. J5C2022 TaxID=2977129 RepID=UPI0021D3D9C6|nr:S-layer homology domain-containing protein [Paenibacillus sp. J5C2022]MCU6710360.1 S-layer homology domain-containing protein [Paenibacillus sp. J5C2022]